MADHWDTWLANVDKTQQELLAEALKRNGIIKNGHNTKIPVEDKTESKAEILTAPMETFMFDTVPPFVDIHGLIPVYNKLAFQYNLLVKGPKGDGKTLSFINYAHATQTPLITVECSQDTKWRNLMGSFLNLSQFQLGPIPQAIDIANTYGRAMIVFEEVNALTPQIQKVLNAVLDFRRFVNIPQIGKIYKLDPGKQLWCVATMNPSVYGGTYDLNEDLRSRWVELEVGYPKHGQEKDIIKAYYPNLQIDEKVVDQCIRFAADTRQQGTGYALSTRDLVDLIGLVNVMSLQDALQLTVCKFEGEDRETVIKRVSSSFAGIRPKKHWGASK